MDVEAWEERNTFLRRMVAPFGRYRRHVAKAEVGTSVFVGREGAKAYLVDALTSNARRGAYLVTGRRGVGKSTFVESCVAEADELKYRRYMRRRAGRTLLDQTVLALCVLSLLILLTADIEILKAQTSGEYTSPIINLFLIIPAVFVLLYALYNLRIAFFSLCKMRSRYGYVLCLIPSVLKILCKKHLSALV